MRSTRRASLIQRLGAVAVASLCVTTASAQTDHWAYQKPVRPSLPNNRAVGWQQNPIDAFVLSKLEANGSSPSARAEPARLLRRVYLDLIGLPPALEEVDAFTRDPSDGAFAKIVDRLLESPRFGEHWARHWLDLARYADSNGFQADQLRDSWAYRDWVVDALNAGMPFDRFTIEQIAGDLLPNATLAQRIATGFHRTVMCNVEAGVDPEQNRVNQVVDRVNTTATVWLGTTMECAQCHDHKYDPFTQKDYYRLFAFYNNSPIEVKLNSGVSYDFYGPKLELPLGDAQRAELAALESELDGLESLQLDVVADASAEQVAWERRLRDLLAEPSRWHVLDVASFDSTGDEDHTILPDKSVLIGGRVPGTANYTVQVDTHLEGISAFRIETLTHPSLPGTGPGRGDDVRPNFILSEFAVLEVALGEGGGGSGSSSADSSSDAGSGNGEVGNGDVGNGDVGKPVRVELHSASADYSQRGFNVANAIDGKQGKGWAIGGGFFKDHYAIFHTQQRVGHSTGTRLTFDLDQNFGRGRTIGRFRLSAFTGDPELLTLPKGIVAILQRANRGPKQQKRLSKYFLEHHPAAARLARKIDGLQKRIARILPDSTLVMVEREKTRDTFVMRRGDYLQAGEAVTTGTPSVLHPFRDEWPRNRLGLARWLVSPDNPLVARVTVNRWWSQVFGHGLVTTEEDFGLRSQAPSHPQLLDWLARELVESGWSMKHVLRTIVTSATYQQSSRRGQAGRVLTDVHNTLFARGPRFRMCAEMIRDNALSIAGLLSLKTKGPPVFPPQPAGLWRQAGRNEPKYLVATDADRFRRGIYVIWRRAAPYPSFVLFDGPDRSTCYPKRSRTNTPMQALTLMNDPAYVEAALGLARRVLLEEKQLETAIEHAFRLALARRPTAAEAQHLAIVFTREQQRFAADPEQAKTLVDNVKGLSIDRAIDRVELAAWFCVATILLNLDETISKG